ncbi:hypothetical protein [Vallitalea maricola]|uniref:Uncharacterized protein n=1 Tax=Vallitalea maricola TaxID=3074433 RepID=A0ACB5ULA8_9FIRM|nr:hypothetical protein AN2V17_29810 [Vallitalea sp. AN17-2]
MSSQLYCFEYYSTQSNKIFSDDSYKVELKYPGQWVKVDGYKDRYGLDDGFFQVSAINGGTLDEVAEQEAFHPAKPYGSKPTILDKVIMGQPAKMILPSPDQGSQMMNQVGLIVAYSKPIIIDGNRYEYFVLWADKMHFDKIARSIKFIE